MRWQPQDESGSEYPNVGCRRGQGVEDVGDKNAKLEIDDGFGADPLIAGRLSVSSGWTTESLGVFPARASYRADA